MSEQLSSIGRALDEISWEWIGDNYPRLAVVIEAEVAKGARPGRGMAWLGWAWQGKARLTRE